MSAIKNINELAVHNFSDGNFGFDPASITVIIEVIVQVMKMLQDCKKSPKESSDILQRPTVLQKFLLRSRVKRTMGRQSYAKDGSTVEKALFTTGKTITADQVAEVFADLG